MNNSRPRVSIIILNWNGWRDTIECLESIYQIDYPYYDVIIVDNGSKDESTEMIKKYCEGKIKVESKFLKFSGENKPIRIIEHRKKNVESGGEKDGRITEVSTNKNLIMIRNEKNYGFAEGNNIGIKYALKVLDPNYVLILNNDTVVERRFLDELVEVGEQNEKIGIVQPKILYYDDLTINTTGMLCDIFGATMHRGKGERDNNQYDNLHEINFFYGSGACILIKKELLYKLGENYFDDLLFAYYEDVDLSWRARLLGFRVVYCGDSICFHKEGKTSGGFNPQTAYWGYRNRIRVLIKNYSIKTLLIVLPITILLEFSMSILSSIYRKDCRYFNNFIKGLVWNINNLKDTLEKRNFIQSIRKVGDKQIMKYMEKNSLQLRFLLKKLCSH